MEQVITAKLEGFQMPVAAPPPKYCLYARKSTEEEDKQVMSIDSQIKEMTAIAQKESLNIVEIKREAHSSKAVGQRPIFNQMMKEVKEGKFNAILTWAPDRLSRNAGDLGTIVDMMDQKLIIQIRTFSQTFTNDPNQKFLLMILGSQAKLENDNKSVNVKRGMKAKCELGWRPCVAPTGYLPETHVEKRGQVRLDPLRSVVIKQIFEKVAYEQWSGRNLYRWLNEIKFKTRNGKPLTLGNIFIILRNSFYYGEFEYPKDSGNWYVGKHTPIINKELFDKVQETLNDKYVPKTESKEFAFTKMIKCGYCGSGITADEKFRKLENGGTNRHVYYFCTKSQDLNCTNHYIKEESLIKELSDLMGRIDLDELGIKERIEHEIERYNRFRKGVLGMANNQKLNTDLNARNYAKYILREGSLMEKRELLSCLKSKLTLRDGHIGLEK